MEEENVLEKEKEKEQERSRFLEKKRLLEKKHLLEERVHAEEVQIEQNRLEILRMEKELEEEKKQAFVGKAGLVWDAIRKKDAIIPPKYRTKTTEQYYKIEKSVLEECILRCGMEVGDFLDFCRYHSFLKEENGKTVFTSGRQRVYFLKKSIMDKTG